MRRCTNRTRFRWSSMLERWYPPQQESWTTPAAWNLAVCSAYLGNVWRSKIARDCIRNILPTKRCSVINDPRHENSWPALTGGVAQWLGRRCLDGRLYLTYAWSIVDMWPLREKRVLRYGSTNQANLAFHPSRVGKWVLIHVITRITGWRPLNSRPGLRTTGWLQVRVRGHGLSIRPIGCTPALSMTQKCRCRCSCGFCRCSCGFWRNCITVIRLCL